MHADPMLRTTQASTMWESNESYIQHDYNDWFQSDQFSGCLPYSDDYRNIDNGHLHKASNFTQQTRRSIFLIGFLLGFSQHPFIFKRRWLNLNLVYHTIYLNEDLPEATYPTFCRTTGSISIFLSVSHFFYLFLFLFYTIFLFRFSLKKSTTCLKKNQRNSGSSSTFWWYWWVCWSHHCSTFSN